MVSSDLYLTYDNARDVEVWQSPEPVQFDEKGYSTLGTNPDGSRLLQFRLPACLEAESLQRGMVWRLVPVAAQDATPPAPSEEAPTQQAPDASLGRKPLATITVADLLAVATALDNECPNDTAVTIRRKLNKAGQLEFVSAISSTIEIRCSVPDK